jgi:hypothetical protein
LVWPFTKVHSQYLAEQAPALAVGDFFARVAASSAEIDGQERAQVLIFEKNN